MALHTHKVAPRSRRRTPVRDRIGIPRVPRTPTRRTKLRTKI